MGGGGRFCKKGFGIFPKIQSIQQKQQQVDFDDLLVCVVLADSKVELSDNQVEKQVDKVEANGVQAVDEVIEPAFKDYSVRTFLFAYLNERTVRGL